MAVSLSTCSALKQSVALRTNGAQKISIVCKKQGSVRCSAGSQDDASVVNEGRRQVLVGALSASIALPLLNVSAGTASAADIIERFQRSEFLALVQLKLAVAIREQPDIVPQLLRLAVHDALTYDKESKSGGANGSIRFSEELGRPENAGLESAVKFLEGVKAEIDAESKGGPISWADLIQFGGQSAAKRSFLEAAISKAGGDEKKGRQLAQAFGSSAQWGFFDKQLGRRDASEADPSGRLFVFQTATVEELKAKLAPYGLKARQLAVLSAFWANDQTAVEEKLATDSETKPYVDKYQKSRKSVSQTDYEVDLITAFTKIASLGASINYEAYTYQRPRPKFRY